MKAGKAVCYLDGSSRTSYTRVTMADMQMRLLRKKIQKRNEKNKKRKLLLKQRDEEEAGKSRE